jgi:hypothetical protein
MGRQRQMKRLACEVDMSSEEEESLKESGHYHFFPGLTVVMTEKLVTKIHVKFYIVCGGGL